MAAIGAMVVRFTKRKFSSSRVRFSSFSMVRNISLASNMSIPSFTIMYDA